MEINSIWIAIFIYFAIIFLFAYNKEAKEKIEKRREQTFDTINIVEHRYGVETLRSQYQISRYQLSQINPEFVETFLEDQKRRALHDLAQKSVKQFDIWEEEEDKLQMRDVKRFQISMSVVNLHKEI